MRAFQVVFRSYLSASSFLICSTWLRGGPSSVPTTVGLETKEEILGEKSDESPASDKEEDTISPDGHQVAWRDKRGQQWVVMLNGQPAGAAYLEVHSLLFSPDGRHLAYAARSGGDRPRAWRLVLDGKEQKEAFGGLSGLTFGAEGRRFGYFGQEKNSAVAVIDGTRGPDYKEILGPVAFSKDAQHYAYAAKKGSQWLVMSDGVEGPLYEDVGRPRFMNNRLFYSAKRRDAWVVMENGKEITPEAKGGYILVRLTPHREELISVAYESKRADRNLRVVIGGREGPLVDSIAVPIRFGATDDHYVYAAHRMKNPSLKAARAFGQIVTDGKEGPPYEALAQSTLSAWMNPSQNLLPSSGVRPWFNPRWHGVSAPAMTADGLHVAYAAHRADKDYIVVADGAEGPSFEAVPCGPTYGPDGTLYYTGFQAGRLVTLMGEKRVSELTWNANNWADTDGCSDFFVWDGGHWGYMTEQGGNRYYSGQTTRAKRRMIVDGQAGPEYDASAIAAMHTQLAGDVFHFSYEVHENKASQNASFVVLDGQETKLYDAVFRGSSQLSGDGAVTFVARSGQRFLRVTTSRP
jgi:hypothetical protein